MQALVNDIMHGTLTEKCTLCDALDFLCTKINVLCKKFIGHMTLTAPFSCCFSYQTSMHSSRMRTARLLTVSGGGVLPKPVGICIQGGSAQPGGGLHPGGSAKLRGGGLHPGEVWIWGGGSAQPGGGGSAWHIGDRMTHMCKNITLPQTSFVGGKYTTLSLCSNIQDFFPVMTSKDNKTVDDYSFICLCFVK